MIAQLRLQEFVGHAGEEGSKRKEMAVLRHRSQWGILRVGVVTALNLRKASHWGEKCITGSAIRTLFSLTRLMWGEVFTPHHFLLTPIRIIVS